ncbi:N-acetylmuramoyl-L-alanine amidase [Anoxybacteroides amylolyticum]|uniref:N-acetylmuramoyl-L-alanine amidase family protein n=1 Tax=Anoxybacteroides amylolyticum TaxID=294699 RepID=A0A160F6A6_9BACL|nr:N-acetylmuramoyl-L-alanine amidase [Anoxybacillus amylolyticus]ANB62139.1 N-acetylmuramoyl-L-alanine amidase family protein [Anoxybacillus amylolyticus]
MLKVAIDAGHGYNTPGKRTPDGSMREWEFNSAVATLVQEELGEFEGVEVLRIDDPTGKADVPLKTRTDTANAWRADVYVSIHANAAGSGWSSAEGIETYVYTSKPKEAMMLAANVQNHLIRETGRKNRGVKTADFHVLRETKMTAILIECGFMTNKEEATLLKSDSYRRKVAAAIVAGIAETYSLKRKSSPAPSTASKDKLYSVQVGAFTDRSNAERLAEELKKKGYPVYITD